MRFHVLNVGHGFCSYLVADNGNVMMFDCGHNAGPGFRPSEFLDRQGVRTVHRLFISNYDEDHISDLPNLHSRIGIEILHRNRSISGEQLRILKRSSGSISSAMEVLISMMDNYTGDVVSSPDFPDITWTPFCSRYITDFHDTNNLSLVTFLTCRGLTFVLPGDLEQEGWRHHLQNEAFRRELSRVNVFVASHHGRESGYCREVFSYCTPAVIVFSDSNIVHASQEMANVYASHAGGIEFNGERRFVLTTRKDGDFWWDV